MEILVGKISIKYVDIYKQYLLYRERKETLFSHITFK